MSGWHRRIVASLLAAMALTPAGAMAGQRTGTLRVTVEVVAQCSVTSGHGATLRQACTTARVEGVVVATPAPSAAPTASEPMQRRHADGLLTVVY